MGVDWCNLPLWMTPRAYTGALSAPAGPGAPRYARAPRTGFGTQETEGSIKPGHSLSSGEKDPMRRRTAKLR